ncbi:hypothetical protein HanXRQr2_Chr13g0599121 [Helianthus annuus]|uniref:Uncharacterized protein n=1 Tax=Helianthus annuus TaxID=4232 RepID=A0A9K3EJD0_HELAN|nr:hypothetical protein HanXRQr2_Chr13g0599121 [Helianthus annuus]KAJ0850148.1 hypothetical protein HanPSC8_Chr13g0577231 [Helianthus annuus]
MLRRVPCSVLRISRIVLKLQHPIKCPITANPASASKNGESSENDTVNTDPYKVETRKHHASVLGYS